MHMLAERLIVESIGAPLGMVNADKDLQNSAGLATCSMTFIVEIREHL